MSLAYHYCPKIIAAGGYCFSYITPLGGSSFSFISSQIVPDISSSDYTALLQPLYAELNTVHRIPVGAPPTNTRPTLYAGDGRRTGAGDFPVNTRYRSRLFPGSLWDNPDQAAWAATFAAIRAGVEEGGYRFHGIAYSPTLEKAGWPTTDSGSGSAVHPAWRTTALHGSFMEVQPEGIGAAEATVRDQKASEYLARLDAVFEDFANDAPRGAYMNEGDPAEEEWQTLFYGDENYARLLDIKKKWDPWAVFWARTTVGGERWEVDTEDGYPMSQNGRLCRVVTKK